MRIHSPMVNETFASKNVQFSLATIISIISIHKNLDESNVENDNYLFKRASLKYFLNFILFSLS